MGHGVIKQLVERQMTSLCHVRWSATVSLGTVFPAGCRKSHHMNHLRRAA